MARLAWIAIEAAVGAVVATVAGEAAKDWWRSDQKKSKKQKGWW